MDSDQKESWLRRHAKRSGFSERLHSLGSTIRAKIASTPLQKWWRSYGGLGYVHAPVLVIGAGMLLSGYTHGYWQLFDWLYLLAILAGIASFVYGVKRFGDPARTRGFTGVIAFLSYILVPLFFAGALAFSGLHYPQSIHQYQAKQATPIVHSTIKALKTTKKQDKPLTFGTLIGTGGLAAEHCPGLVERKDPTTCSAPSDERSVRAPFGEEKLLLSLQENKRFGTLRFKTRSSPLGFSSPEAGTLRRGEFKALLKNLQDRGVTWTTARYVEQAQRGYIRFEKDRQERAENKTPSLQPSLQSKQTLVLSPIQKLRTYSLNQRTVAIHHARQGQALFHEWPKNPFFKQLQQSGKKTTVELSEKARSIEVQPESDKVVITAGR